MTENAIAKQIVDAAFRIHTTLGRGLLKSVYYTPSSPMNFLSVAPNGEPAANPVVYGAIRIDVGFRADLIVEDQVIVEIKSVEALAPVHRKQLLTYLQLADKRSEPTESLPCRLRSKTSLVLERSRPSRFGTLSSAAPLLQRAVPDHARNAAA